MIPLYSPSQVRELDNFAVSAMHVPSIVLMENAALNIREILLPLLEQRDCESVCIVCGKGNNGGDGYTVARHLVNEGFNVTVVSLYPASALTPDAATNYVILKNSDTSTNLKFLDFYKIKRYSFTQFDVIIEAILGSGFSGVPDDYISGMLKQMNNTNAFKVAIDVPAGLNSDTGAAGIAFQSDITITLGGLKRGLFFNNGKKYSGDVYGAGIGISDNYLEQKGTNTFLITPEHVAGLVPHRKIDAHKYSSGKILHLSGSKQYPGAAVLASIASFKTGAGASVTTAGSSYINRMLQLSEPYQVYEEFDDNDLGCFSPLAITQLAKKIAWADVLVIGSGMGAGEEAKAFVNQICNDFPKKLKVIDADGLSIVNPGNKKNPDLHNAILTPHMGEFSKMTGLSIDELRINLPAIGSGFCLKHHCHLILKDFVTIIFSPDGMIYINSTGNAGLAKFGSGDVLSGMIGGFYAQVKNPLSAAILAVYLHGLTADILKESKTELGYTAKDLLEKIPQAIKIISGSCA
ncbi:MAG: NAD(P)H-hydrate dehydratase [Ignavibacteriales bacterium]|nr:NAD(P)H-hydrate dehydratase [Ignavibacteriales bacterium]